MLLLPEMCKIEITPEIEEERIKEVVEYYLNFEDLEDYYYSDQDNKSFLVIFVNDLENFDIEKFKKILKSKKPIKELLKSKN